MTITDYQKMFKGTLKPETVFAGEILESRHLRFGSDYGITNAIQKATDIVIESLEAMEEWDKYGHGV